MSERKTDEKATPAGSGGPGAGGAIGAIVGAIAGAALLYGMFGERVEAGAAELGFPAIGLAVGAIIGAVLLAAIGGASSIRAGFLIGLLVPTALFVAPAFAPKAEEGSTASVDDEDGSATPDPESAVDDDTTATVGRLEAELKIRDAELESAQRTAKEASDDKEAAIATLAKARDAFEKAQQNAADLAAKLAAQKSMLSTSDEAALKAREELDAAQRRIAELQAKYGLERSKLLEKISELEGPAAGFEAKIRTLEAAGYHACGVVMNVEKSRYGDRLAIRTSVDAARIGGEGILRAPDGTILAVIEYVIGREDALSAKVLYSKEDARIAIGDVVYSRLK